jgi:pimeloyl-ACP methyl ester carboxylesterase
VRVDRFELESAALRDNPLRDPSRREVLVLVPPGYDGGSRRFPTLYLLAAYASLGATFLARACFEEALDQRLARLFATGCPPALVVLPDAATRYGGSQYVNSSALGRYADHVVREVVPAIDARYRTIATAGGRALLGRSSGGFGALHLALEHPELFGAVACHSGDLGFELCYPPDFPVSARTLERDGGIAPFLASFFSRPKRSSEEFTTIATIAMAAAYSPEPRAEHGFELPFDPASCELRADVFARWLAFDPVRRIAGGAAKLRALRRLFVDCGLRDEHHLQFGARRFARECRAHGVAVEHEEYDDSHRGTSYRFDVSIPRIVRALDGASA